MKTVIFTGPAGRQALLHDLYWRNYLCVEHHRLQISLFLEQHEIAGPGHPNYSDLLRIHSGIPEYPERTIKSMVGDRINAKLLCGVQGFKELTMTLSKLTKTVCEMNQGRHLGPWYSKYQYKRFCESTSAQRLAGLLLTINAGVVWTFLMMAAARW
ncbi:hypothetical protein Bb109J_c1980 [Bdellovibrio bacteriovorus]|uniref:hypothetical protein n=1 Tax=Bdellovibrio bacteriovorus TaxID=959 RepID=UPI00045C12AA|nr:hypothetical protein [Bdellovibrio bacteriovorus]AHZ84670.1 hypothetical protein EP01_06930 [Bdellovibrio bacteriovorus]BEV68560.1 hypothetical protein Bb109J_c1980 [Bdellovibrio bacteriovorus]